MSTELIVAIAAVAAIVLLGAGWMLLSQRRTNKLKERYGPEYEYMQSVEGRREAEKDLVAREKRVAKFEIKELGREERRGYLNDWQMVQAKFVDDPASAMLEADILVQKVMFARGYPLSDFEQQAADISVDHPEVVRNYRAAHDLSERSRRGQAGTEDLRQGLLHYRALFDDLLGEPVAAQPSRTG